jgi:hypothetical protein
MTKSTVQVAVQVGQNQALLVLFCHELFYIVAKQAIAFRWRLDNFLPIRRLSEFRDVSKPVAWFADVGERFFACHMVPVGLAAEILGHMMNGGVK